MKKTSKKLLTLALTLIMALALAIPTFAVNTSTGESAGNTTENTGSITITSSGTVSVDGHKFTAYRVLDVTYDGDSAYSYTVNSDFDDFTFNDNTVTASNLVEYLSSLDDDSAELKAISYALTQYAMEHNVTGTTVIGSEGEAKFENLPYGYYVIYPQDGTAIVCAIDTVVGNVSIVVKNTYPTLEKEVVSIDGDSENTTSGSIGDNVTYQLTTKVIPDVTGLESYTYEITDTMSKGLTFNNDVTITIGGIALETSAFTVTPSTDPDSKVTTITITITDPISAITAAAAEDGYDASKGIVTTYSATINQDAEVYSDLTNSASLEYGNNQNTVTDSVAVQTYDFDFRKFTDAGEGDTDKQYDEGDTLLANAKFKLTATNDKDAAGIEFVLVDGVYYVATDTDSDTTTELVSVSTGNGIVNVKGLKAGTYYLWETAAPEGYNVIDTATEITVGDADDASIVYNIYNGTGTELPETGGIGTTLFYVVGGALVLGAAVLLITKKRVHDAED